MPRSLWQQAEVAPDRLAVVESDGSLVSFGEFAEHANRMARVFVARGARRGDHLCAMTPNGSRALEVIAAAYQVGLHYTPLNFHLTPDDIDYIVSDSGASIFVAHERFADLTASAAGRLAPDVARLAIGRIDGFEPLLDLMAHESPELPPDRNVGARMYYTSGTTGRPKGLVRPLGEGDVDVAAVEHGLGLWRMASLDPDDDGPFLQCGPMYHPSPMGFAIGALNLGKPVVVTEGFDPEHVLSLVQEWRCDSSHMVPTMFVRLLKLPPEVRGSYDVSSLHGVVHAAAPCSVDVKRQMIDWLGPIIHEYYSSTEGVGGTRVDAQEWLEHPGTVGKVPPGSTAIMDDDGNVLGPDEVGTVYSRHTFDYHNDPEKTASARRGEWSTVGDIGFVDADGYLYLVDRVADVINSGGVNIYPTEVEAVLLQHDAVADAAVIGVPNDEFGEEVKAVVLPIAGVQGSDELAAALVTFCRERAPHYRCPRTIDFVSELPRGENGKLLRRKVREPYWAGKASRIV